MSKQGQILNDLAKILQATCSPDGLLQEHFQTATPYNWTPEAINKPIGTACGIFPGRGCMVARSMCCALGWQLGVDGQPLVARREYRSTARNSNGGRFYQKS